jgi:hypothetical protein
MIQSQSPFSNGVAAVVIAIVAITALSIDTAINAYAQNMTTPSAAQQQNQTVDPQQIKNYLTQAIQEAEFRFYGTIDQMISDNLVVLSIFDYGRGDSDRNVNYDWYGNIWTTTRATDINSSYIAVTNKPDYGISRYI